MEGVVDDAANRAGETQQDTWRNGRQQVASQALKPS
jgi:hypothetical protein